MKISNLRESIITHHLLVVNDKIVTFSNKPVYVLGNMSAYVKSSNAFVGIDFDLLDFLNKADKFRHTTCVGYFGSVLDDTNTICETTEYEFEIANEDTDKLGVVFSEILCSENNEIKVSIESNELFNLLFINTKTNLALKRMSSYENKVSMDLTPVDPLLKAFAVESVINYSKLVYNLLLSKINSTSTRGYKGILYRENRLFVGNSRTSGNSSKFAEQSFFPLFVETSGLYNPFKENIFYQSETRGGSSYVSQWFADGGTGIYLVEKNSPGNSNSITDFVKLYFITNLDFCRKLGLSHKLGFNSKSAQQYFAGLIGPWHVDLPSIYFGTYVKNNKLLKQYQPGAKCIDTLIKFVLDNQSVLSSGENSLTPEELYAVLSAPYIGSGD